MCFAAGALPRTPNSALPDPLAGFKGSTFKGREEQGKGRDGRGRKRKGAEGERRCECMGREGKRGEWKRKEGKGREKVIYGYFFSPLIVINA